MAVALAVRQADFAGLARHGLFGGLAFREYLRRTESQLRALCGQGVEVHLRVLDPADYEDYCEALGFDPGGAAARVAYAADPELAGEPFVYAGERLAGLLPALADDHRARVRITIACTALLDALGEGPAGQPRMVAVMTYVTSVYLAVAEGAGEGRHLLTLWCHGPEDGEELTAAADVRVRDGRLLDAGRDTEALCVTLAAGVAAGGAGALLLHGDPAAPGGQEVRGWALEGGRMRPMSAQEVFDSLADDVGRGLPFPPGAVPLPGFALPGPWRPGPVPPGAGPGDGAGPGGVREDGGEPLG
ncbi:hypothetical protein [Streptomyces sp. CB01881]|uniref:hypothetical protein n=1 Tax=Streptomyces sp. CB01881 TaxID=2078691 RepID=UPI000CDC4110|nr:hypothetical protein [Streptomyces sp. CB01881]AUY48939.1 hypothetical protein C2142_08215 [Streptomyces sp. CB01881]